MQSPPRRYQQLQPEDRVTLASLVQQKRGVREMALALGRSPSTISRELRRNAAPSVYTSASARACAQQGRRHSRAPNKLHREGLLFKVGRHFLHLRWSPKQIAVTLAHIYPKNGEHRVLHETIYSGIYAQPAGELKRELIATLRHAHNKRVPRRKGQVRRGPIPDMLSIHLHPPGIKDRQVPGHWEGDLIKGVGNASAVCTLVERTSRLVMLVRLPDYKPASAANVLQRFTDKLLSIAVPIGQSTTCVQGRGRAMHRGLSRRAGIAVYFCDLRSPWQRGSNANMNGLVRLYLPKGTDLSIYSQVRLDAIADEINGRPRKGLGVRSALAVYRELHLNSPQHSTLVH